MIEISNYSNHRLEKNYDTGPVTPTTVNAYKKNGTDCIIHFIFDYFGQEH